MKIREAYGRAWKYKPPRKVRAMHDAGLFVDGKLRFAVFEFYDPETIADGDAWVADDLVPGLVPIGGDSSGDRWCFDTRMRIGGTTPILHCPHDGGGAVYVAPSFAGFVYRQIVENLIYAHIFADRGIDRAGVKALTLRNLKLAGPWLLKRWQRDALALVEGTWPEPKGFDAWMRKDPAFAAMPDEELEHFR